MEPTSDRGLYVHVPFCRSRCHFCAFYLEIHQPVPAASFVRALRQEIALYRKLNVFKAQPITSVYFGGGTPTTLSSQDLRSILATIQDSFMLDPLAEISIEAHPTTVTESMLAELREAGFNRVSLGGESMEDQELVRVGRPGSSTETARAVEAAKRADFSNINLDLMYGLPTQTTESWLASLQRALALAPTHVSCYALTIEEGTRLERAVRRGDIPAPDPEIQITMEELTEQQLTAAGYHRYEISNYARDEAPCRHNLLYWNGGAYLGLGPSAQSYLDDLRYGNVGNLAEYAGLLDAGRLPRVDVEHLSTRQRAREAAVFGLRKIAGIPARLLFDGESAERASIVQRLMDEDYLERSGDAVRLTPKGRRYADEVSVQLL